MSLSVALEQADGHACVLNMTVGQEQVLLAKTHHAVAFKLDIGRGGQAQTWAVQHSSGQQAVHCKSCIRPQHACK